ncbi:MAG: SdrD B-like domain-containing protein [Saprospiraceae bacterium]
MPAFFQPVESPNMLLSMSVIAAPNLIVDSNVESPSTYAPEAVHFGVQICNNGTDDMSEVFVNIGDFAASPATPGVYRQRTVSESTYSGTFSLTHSGSTADATRYIKTLAAGECTVQYWLVEYPRLDPSGEKVTGGSKTNDDLFLEYDIWATADDNGTLLNVYETSTAHMRSEISAMANKIWPNGTNKVPQEYLDAIEGFLGWNPQTGSGFGGTIRMDGIWFDLGRINKGFDNNGDYVPDYNIFMQPVGDPAIFDPDCFRLVKTYGLVIVKKTDGTEELIPFEDQMYFENLPQNNNGAVGLVYYEFVALKGPCNSSLTPYQEVASGSDNEKFNGDYGTYIPSITSTVPNATLDDTGVVSSPVNNTVEFNVTLTNSTGGDLGLLEYGLPVVMSTDIPAGTEYIAGSAALNNTLPSGITATILYSIDGGVTWTSTEPATAADVTNIQWWMSDAIPNTEVVDVTFQTNIPSGYTDPTVSNTGTTSLGGGDSFLEDSHTVLISGINSISGTAYEDDGGTSGVEWTRIQDGDESGLSSVTVTLYYDRNGNGIVDENDVVWETKSSDVNGDYTFSNLADGNYVVVVDEKDTDITSGYVYTSTTSESIALDPNSASGVAVDQTDTDFGFGPAIQITKTLMSSNPAYESDTISYKLNVSNRGEIPLSTIPVIDTFDADRLEFLYAEPRESAFNIGGSSPHSNTGLISWTNIGSVNASMDGGSSPNIVAQWNFEEGSGTTTTDASGNNLTGTLLNGPSWASGRTGNGALQFDGTDDLVTAPDLSRLGNSFAVSFWALTNPMVTASNVYVCQSNGGGDFIGEWFVVMSSTGGIQFTYNNSGTQINVPSNYFVDDGNWHHITVNYDGSTIYFYVDGVVVNSQALSVNISGTEPLEYILGNNLPTITTNHLNGVLDQVTIYDGHLSAEEINRLIETASIEDYSNQEVMVYFKAKEPSDIINGDVTINKAEVNGATFTNGDTANNATASAEVTILNTGSISGYIWNDLNGSGWSGTQGWDGSDAQLENIRVILHECTTTGGGGSCNAGAGSTTTYSDANGYYEFTGLREDKFYYIEVVSTDIPGAVSGTADPDDDGINSGNGGLCSGGNNCDDEWDRWSQMGNTSWGGSTWDWENISFGFSVQPGLFGNIWEDIDGDGIQEVCEEGLAGVTVTLSNGSTAITDANGDYSFGGLLSSTAYTISVTTGTLPSGSGSWTETAESDASIDNSITYTLGAGEISGSHSFGFSPSGSSSVGDALYSDWDGDGIQDAGETNLLGVTVNIYKDENGDGAIDPSRDAFIATTTTTATGYNFANLPAGDYIIEVVESSLPANLNQTADPDETGITCTVCNALASISVDGTSSYNGIDFGYQPIGGATISGTLWQDSNGDQAILAESTISNVTVELWADTDGDGNYELAVTTNSDADGNYSFDNLPDGNYQVKANTTDTDIPKDAFGNPSVSTTGYSYDFVVSSNDVTSINSAPCTACSDDLDFGFAKLGAIGSTIYSDANGNGAQDWTENGIEGVTVYLCDAADGTCNSGNALQTVVTDENGNYLFTGLAPDDYTVAVDAGSLGAQTADPDRDGETCVSTTYPGLPSCDDQVKDITLSYGTSYMGANFGYQASGVIGDYIWLDADADGIQDAGEPGIGNVEVALVNTTGVTIDAVFYAAGTYHDTVYTDLDGYYTYSDLPDGTYNITVTTPTDRTVTYDADGTADGTTQVVISSGTATIAGNACSDCSLDADFGYKLNGAFSLSGNICQDEDGDGNCSTGGETQLEGTTVYLYNATGVFLGETTTNSSGSYTFDNLPTDTYIVAVGTTENPLSISSTTTPGVTTTTASVYQTQALSANVTGLDFGFQYEVDIDFGDLPSSYEVTTLEEGGAYHIVPSTPTLYLGTAVDSELSPTQNTAATGDATDDGVTFSNLATWTEGTNGGNFDATVSGTGWLVAWIDFNQDGDISDPGEMVISQAVTSGTATYDFDIPAGASLAGTTYSRIRLFETEPAFAKFSYAGEATNGEVEDYRLVFPVLPVDLSSFRVMAKNCDVQLIWKTESEDNFNYFEVERSDDGREFKSIETFKGQGDQAAGQTYRFVDDEAGKSNYYRLKMVDYDGSFEYSTIRHLSLECGEFSDLTVYPNPISPYDKVLNIEFLAKGEEAQILITNMLGRTVRVLNVGTEKNISNMIRVDISDLPPGSYLLKELNTRQSKMIVVQ